jgi:two-component system sensor histidine kinase BaeS
MTAPSRQDGRSLAGRVVASSLLGSCVVAVVAVLLAVPLVRGVARDQSRAELARAVEALAESPRISAQLVAREERAVGPDDRRYGLVTNNGTSAGDALADVTASDLAELRRTGTLSTSHRVDGRDYLVEGRLIRTGVLANRGALVLGAQPTSGVGAATGALLGRLGLALLLGLVAAGAVSFVVARRMSGRVREAAERAHRLAGGERGLPEPEPSHLREVDEMSSALTRLDTALAGSEGRQREFLLSISHDLRTPLTALRGYAEALRDGAIPADEVAEVGATLTTETERLGSFITDLLALARLEADDFRLQQGPVDVGEVLRLAATAWRATATAHAVELVVAVPADPAPFAGDPMRIRQLVDGLLENALRATPAGGRVELRAEQDRSTTTISVTDTGPGLEPGDHERAFDRGYLRERYAAHRDVGTGLGLSIAQRLAQRMGGTLRATSGEAGGTVMTLRLEQRTGVPADL